MQKSQAQSIVRWWVIAASILATDVAATLWVVAARSVGFPYIGSGSFTKHIIHYNIIDGSRIVIVRNNETGTTIGRTVIRPATTAGLCRVWWPVFAAGPLTLMGFALALTRGGRRWVAEFSLPRMTTKGLMIAAAILVADLGWVFRTLGSSWRGLFIGQWTWTPALVDMLIVQTLALMAVGVAALFFFVRRRPGCRPNLTYWE
jgi:hypothetical protein